MGVFQFLERANSAMPFAAACLDDGSWPLSSAEVYDNYRSALHVLGDHLVPGEEEKEGFFTAPRTEAQV